MTTSSTALSLVDRLHLAPLERVTPPDLDTFRHKYLLKGRPVVFAGAAGSWPCVRKWTLEYLAEACGHNAIIIRSINPTMDTSQRTISRANGRSRQSFDNAVSEERTTLGRYLDDIRHRRHGLRYLQEVPVKDALPQLLSDVPSDHYTRVAPSEAELLLGADTYAPCHYHPFVEAISTQVIGQRRFILFAPDQTPFLYSHKPYPSYNFSFSHVNFRSDTLETWPLLKHANGYEAVLNPGDSIYLPVQYWHTVFSLGGLSVLLVRFFPSSWTRYHYPAPGLRLLTRPLVDRVRATRAWIGAKLR